MAAYLLAYRQLESKFDELPPIFCNLALFWRKFTFHPWAM
jgi:hypothetical protein